MFLGKTFGFGLGHGDLGCGDDGPEVGRRAALADNPFLDDHLVYAMVLIDLALYGVARTWGLGRAWGRLPIVQRFSFVQ